MIENSTNRIAFIDAMKLLGMLAIFIGHLPESGPLIKFVFTYHVQFFFFMSGCFAISKKNLPFSKFVLGKVKSILIPYIFFLIITIAVQALFSHWSINEILNHLKLGLLAVRFQVWPFQLWFLPCLFIVTIIYEILRRFLKNILIIFLVSFIISAITYIYFPRIPALFFGIESAFLFIAFYSFGSLIFPILKNLEINYNKKSLVKFFVLALGILSLIYAVMLFLEKDILFKFFVDLSHREVSPVSFLGYGYLFIQSVILFYANFVLALFLSKIKLIPKIGANSLYLCGNEAFIKILITSLLSLAGINFIIRNPLLAVIYSMALIVIIHFLLAPVEKIILKFTTKKS